MRGFLNSSPFPVYEEYEECCSVRGLWRHRWRHAPGSLGIPQFTTTQKSMALEHGQYLDGV